MSLAYIDGHFLVLWFGYSVSLLCRIRKGGSPSAPVGPSLVKFQFFFLVSRYGRYEIEMVA